MSRTYVQMQQYAEGLLWAEKAFDEESSKQSLFAVFRAKLYAKPQPADNALLRVIDQLRARDDFEIEDLLAIGKLASEADPKRQDIALHVLDELCRMLVQTDTCPADLPTSVVLQNAAQLSFTRLTEGRTGSNLDLGITYGEKFLTYVSALLQQSRSDTHKPKHSIGPSSVFEWFFRMSFDIARSTEDSKYFIAAADIAEMSDGLYMDQSPLKHQRKQCLVAALSSDMMKIDRLDKSQLLRLLEVIKRIKSIPNEAVHCIGDIDIFLVKATIAVKLRLFDPNTNSMLEICKAALHSASELVEVGGTISSRQLLPNRSHLLLYVELVLYASKFTEASEVRLAQVEIFAATFTPVHWSRFEIVINC
ncbi:unnamed protein product [Phytophthora fragariaefolia]|uniref:Unnamed protein product n=1 Tax=Phytophthora fragariaefolia TaxID=1490495 RepID=A0A9W6XNC7_9STRA|nr:unnamed protein product [Phytophthora fragariaefolia]